MNKQQISSKCGWCLMSMLTIVGLLYGSVTASAITYKTLPTTVGATLENNVIYTVSGSPTIAAGDNDFSSALKVRANATTTIYIPKGCTLTVSGSKANSYIEAYAGIEVPSTSTLIITGEGTLVVRGGDGGQGAAGGNGGNAVLSIPDKYGTPGQGGAGGAGGGGAAAGIGGNGGRGHVTQNGPTRATVACNTSVFDGGGNAGYDSQNGSNGGAMGKVYILGSVQVKAYRGSTQQQVSQPGNVGSNADDAGSGWSIDYAVGGGGPGGSGGNGYAPQYGIGGGGPGGQCGATGGTGGSYWRKSKYDYVYIVGGAGAGGAGSVNGLTQSETRTSRNDIYGGEGGKMKANAAVVGDNGTLYLSPTASLYVDGDRKADYSISSHYAIAATITLNANGGYLDEGKSTTTVYYGIMPDAVTIPTKSGYTCTGYYTAAEGGEMVFNSTGEASAVCTNLTYGTLYAHWRVSAVSNYINTKGEKALELSYTANEKTKTVVHVKLNSLHRGNNMIFGTSGSNDLSSRDIYGVWVDGTDKNFHFASGSASIATKAGMVEIGKDYYITLENGYFQVDTVADASDHIYHKDFAVYPYNTNAYNITIGGCNKPDASDAYSDITVYEVKISEGDTEKYHLIPAFVSVNGENGYGMYDQVYEKSYASNQGSAFEGDITPCADGKHPGFTCTSMTSTQGGTRHCVVCGYSERITPDTEPYISFNGTSYFNTGYKPNSKTTVKMHFVQHDSYGSNTCQDFFGVRVNNSSFCMLSFPDSTVTAVVNDATFTKVMNHGLSSGHEYYLTMSTSNVKITADKAGSAVLVDYDYDSPTLSSSYEMPVGAINYGNTYGTCIANYDLFSLDIYEDDVLKHSFMPSSRLGHYGYLDTVDNTFHPMVGSAASANSEAEDDNYISTNGTSYLDTNYSPNNDTYIYTHIKKNAENTFLPVFGTNNSTNSYSSTSNYYFSIVQQGDAVCFNIGGVHPDLTYPTNASTDYYIHMSKAEGVVINADTDEKKSSSLVKFALTYTNNVANAISMYVGGHHAANNSTWRSDIKIYEFDIKEGDIYKRHFIPAKRGSTLGFYEAVGNLFYAMQGSGATGLINPCTEHKYLSREASTVDGKRCRKCLVCDEWIADTISIAKVNTSDKFSIDYKTTANTEIRMHVISNQSDAIGTWCSSSDGNWALVNDNNKLMYLYGGKSYSDDDFMLGEGEYYITMNKSGMTVDADGDGLHVSKIAMTTSSSAPESAGTMLFGYNFSNAYNIVSMDIYESGKMVRHYIPAKQNNVYGVFDTFTQTFTSFGASADAANYVAECNSHSFLDYTCDANEKWQKVCRVCGKTMDLSDEEEQGDRFIRTNSYSYFDTQYAPTADTKVVTSPTDLEYDINSSTITVGPKSADVNTKSTNIYSIDIYEGEDRVHHFIPCIYQGKAGMYDTETGKSYPMVDIADASCNNVASEYVPDCGYHRYYTLQKSNGVYYKNCSICGKSTKENMLTIYSTEQLSNVIPETGNTIYLDMVQDGQTDGQNQYTDTKYPAFSSKETCIFDFAVMNKGVMKHHYLPGKFNGKAGLYDAVCDSFIVVPNSSVQIVDCENHKYCKEYMTDGEVRKHCYICDYTFSEGYYMDIAFNANGGRGTMAHQIIIDSDALTPNTFTKELGVFAGWNIDKTGSTVDDGAILKATDTRHGSITLYAIWNDAFTYNGDTLAINMNTMENIHIVDNGKYGFATSAGFNAKDLSFTRQLDDDIKYGTICLPFGIASDDNVSLYTVKSIEEVADGASVIDVIKLQKVDSVKAGEACIFRLNDGNDSQMVTFTCEADSLVKDPIATGNNGIFINGCFTDTTLICNDASVDYYGVMDDHFINVTSSLTVKPYRAYITRVASASAKPEALYLDFGDGITGILPVSTNGISLDDAEIYTSDGIKLSAPRKGSINIVKPKDGEIMKIKF